MEHCRDETLALLALGEPAGSTQVSQHLSRCAPCRSRLDELIRTVGVARSIVMSDVLVRPPADLWDSIATEFHDGLAPPASGIDTDGRSPRSRSITWVSAPWVLAVTAATLVIAATGGIILLDRDPGLEVIASARLSSVGAADLTGFASLTRTTSGQVLSVDVPGLVAGSGYYEVWMASPDSVTMIAIGALGSDLHGDYSLPAGIRASEYPIVDISYEQVDGNPAHSLVSVVRGTLTS